MQRDEVPGKAEGSSDARTKPYKYNVSASRPQRTSQRPPTSEQQPEVSSGHFSQYNASSSRRMSFLHEQHFAAATTPEHEQDHASHHDEDSEAEDNSEEWDIIPRPDPIQPSSSNPQNTSQSYAFPGTWPAALTDTRTAFSQVHTATASYASALNRSGLGKASLSIGSALATSATNTTYSLAAWAVDRTGTGHDQLPRPIGRWMKSCKEHEDEARKAKARRLRRRGVGEGNGDRPMYDAPHVFRDDESSFVIEQYLMDCRSLEIIEPMQRIYQGGLPVRRGQEEWREENTRVLLDELEEALEELGGGEEEEGSPVIGDDGLLRQFQFDD